MILPWGTPAASQAASPSCVGSTRGYSRSASSPSKAASSFAPVASRILPCVPASHRAAAGASGTTTLSGGRALAPRSSRLYGTPAARHAARMFPLASAA